MNYNIDHQKGMDEAFERIKMIFPEFAKFKESVLNNPGKESHFRQNPFKNSVMIIAGGASLMDEKKTKEYQEILFTVMVGFKGTIISGGTTAGIPGLVGRIKADLNKNASVAFDLLGYLPKKLPESAIKSEAYDRFHETDSDEFSALEILSYWADIILSGIDPIKVLLIGIDGGSIAALEYKTALILGAKVCLLTSSGRAVSEILKNKKLNKYPNLIRLPDDPHGILRIINQITGLKLPLLINQDAKKSNKQIE
jgi:hypothetical protein